MDETTLPLWNESKHYYVGPLVTEMNAVPVGLRNAWFSAVGLFLGRKIKNFTLTKCFYFSILHTPAKFQASIFNNKRKSTSGGPIALRGAFTLWVHMLTNHSIDLKYQYCV